MPTYKIHPAIGFARVGNSPESFIGPEKRYAGPQTSSYKDSKCRIKRQAARFRIFEYPDDGSAPFELTLNPGDTIQWTVNLTGYYLSGPGPVSVAGVGTSTKIESTTLVVDGDPASGHVLLGHLETEPGGRLQVLGGFGWSQLQEHGGFDDTCEGPVSVSVSTSTGTLDVAPAWVVAAPPKYAPEMESIVTLYDKLMQRIQGSAPLTTQTKYTEHIYPILVRAQRMRWLLSAAMGHHTWDLTNPESLPKQQIFGALKNPNGAVGGTMPQIAGLTLTPLQYAHMSAFANGNYLNDWTGEPTADLNPPTPAELDRAALEACVGGPFGNGIDVGVYFDNPGTFEADDPARVRHDYPPSSLFRFNLEAWPSDYNACSQWPVARPEQVVIEGGGSEDWDRGAETRELMSANWAQLGFVVKQADGTFVLSERCLDVSVASPSRSALRLLDSVRRFIDIVDPPPPEVGRLRQVVERIEDALSPAPVDALSRLSARLDQMNESELRSALVEARAERSRAEAATQLIEAKLGRLRESKKPGPG